MSASASIREIQPGIGDNKHHIFSRPPRRKGGKVKHGDVSAAVLLETVARQLAMPRSAYGRLELLASLQEPLHGRYFHANLSERFGREALDQAARAIHEQVFAELLNLSLEQQTADLLEYLSPADSDEQAGRHRQRLAQFDRLPPDSANDVERQLFVCDLRVVSAVIGNENPPHWYLGDAWSIRPDHRVVRMMEEARRQHGHAQLTLKGLGLPLRTCGRQLGRLFKRCTGMAFREYLRNVRMLEATARLLRTSQSVQQIALALGYGDSANFTNDFKRRLGLSPVEFRRSRVTRCSTMSVFHNKQVRF